MAAPYLEPNTIIIGDKWKEIHNLIDQQRKIATPQGNKDLRFMLIYLGMDYAALDNYAKDLKAELEKKEADLYLAYKNSGIKYTIPEIEAMVSQQLEALSDEIRSKQKDVSEMRILYESVKDYCKSIDTELFITNQMEKVSF